MRRLLLTLFCALTFSATVADAQRTRTYEQITVADTAIGIATATLANMAQCSARLETAEIRWRHDGTAPTTTVGTPMQAGDVLTFADLRDAAAFRAIRTGSTSGTLNVWCEAR